MNKKIVAFSLIISTIIAGISSYIGVFVYAMYEYNGTARNIPIPDSSTFIEANNSRLYSMALWYEENIAKFHMPEDMIVNTRFNSTEENSIPTGYHVEYDSAEWTGHYLVAEAARYVTHLEEGNQILADYALANLSVALRGIDKILHVSPNNGMARYAWRPSEYWWDAENIREGHYWGTWKGEDYIFSDDTSRDMHNGVIMGLGFAYYAITDNSTIRDYIRFLIEEMLDTLIEKGFLYLNPEDVPQGTDLDDGLWVIGTNGIWTLAYLKVGAYANPEKYGDLYREYAIDRDYLHRGYFPDAGKLNLVQGYYGLLLDWELLFILLTLEDDPGLRKVYLDYNDYMFNYSKNDRNALFSMMWLVKNDYSLDNNTEREFRIKDVEDCLMRYYNARQRLPGRNINLNNPELQNQVGVKWRTFFIDGVGAKLYPYWKSVFQFEDIAQTPLTPDYRPQTDFLWSRPPYLYKEENQNALYEGPSVDFTVVYWLGRMFNVLETPDVFDAKIEVIYGGP